MLDESVRRRRWLSRAFAFGRVLACHSPPSRVLGGCLILNLAWIAAGGCGQRHDAGLPDYNAHEALRARTARVFNRAIYFKPRETTAAPRLSMLPLIVEETGDDSRVADETMPRQNGPCLQAGATKPTIFTASSAAIVRGRRLEQISYVWCVVSPGGGDVRPAWCGTRMTLGGDGYPIAWELLAEPPGEAILFVSQSLETACAKELGRPLHGRKFFCEQSEAAQPHVVVARILEDGPEPMGPFVYLDAHGSITTLLCRCMPSQFREAARTLYYDLCPLAAGATSAASPAAARASVVLDSVFPLAEMADPVWLERALRWPSTLP